MATSLEGQTLGKYRVLEPLGSGGMARVYRGYHSQLDRFVALKVLRSDLVDDDAFLSRFRNEAQAVAGLRHPHIIHVYDFDVQDDVYFMVMELLDGDTLHTRLNEYRVRDEHVPYGEMVRILLDVLDGLAYAHEEGMIHRDIKPANILLTKRGQAVVADFGIAQIVGGTRHTVSGALLGTLNYMSPEQGLKGISDARSDLYSLGVVFYEMLTRQPPYDADTPLAILMKHVNDPLPLPREIDPSLPPPFERVVLKVMAKEPDDRYQSAAEMASALRQAAKEAAIDVPEQISLPMTFTTADAPSESVAVYSGTERAKLVGATFAAEDTRATMDESWTAHLEVLKEQEAASMVGVKGDTAVPSVPSSAMPAAHKSGTGTTIFNAAVLFVVGVLLIVMVSGLSRGDYWAVAWPAVILLWGAGNALLLQKLHIIWFLIPTGILVGNGFLFAFYTLTKNWDWWAFLWPLEVFLVLGVIWLTINRAQRGSDAQWCEQAGKRWKLAALIGAGLLTLLAIPFS